MTRIARHRVLPRRKLLKGMLLGAPALAAASSTAAWAGPAGGRAAEKAGMKAVPACDEAIPAVELGVLPGGGEQTRALRRALEQAAVLGKAVRLPPGDVVIGELEVNAPVRLLGGANSRLVCRGGARWLMKVRGADACLLAGVRMEGSGQRRARDGDEGLLMLQNVARAQVLDCTIEGAGGNGVQLEQCGGVLSGNRIRQAAEAAIFSLDGRDLEIIRNDVADCGNGGILVWQSEKRHDGALVAHNRIRRIRADAGGDGPYGNGVVVFRGAGVRVVENDIAECAFSAVRDNSGDDVVIARNLCRRSGEVAIYVEFSFVNAQVANNLVEGAAAGISITNMGDGGRRAVVSGNIVRDVKPVPGHGGEEGYGIGAEADTTIVGNVVERAAKYGLGLGWGPYMRNVVASGNVVRQSPVGVAVSTVEGAGKAIIAANIFEQVKLAVAGYDHARRITGELLGARRPPRNVVLNANSRG